ncbi:hypothetical protein D5S17_27640 [Pseudonocardiaceae bacterium YIM PH 21723]|nr:hypothetical protein D5S17_27640 [Pseudonocardiaceae bacterium YIM PH 21723]
MLVPWRAANEIYSISDGVMKAEGRFGKLGFRRSAAGFITVVLVSLSYGKSARELGDDGLKDLIGNAVLSVVAVLLLIGLSYAITRPGLRQTLNPGALRVLRNVVLILLTVALPGYLISQAGPVHETDPHLISLAILVGGPLFPTAFLYFLSGRRVGGFLLLLQVTAAVFVGLCSMNDWLEDPTGVLLIKGFVGFPAGIWWVAYLPFIGYWIARSVLWVGEVHPMLAPIGSLLVVLTALANKFTNYQQEGMPYTVWLVITLTGVVTTAALSFAELRSLYGSGYRLRGGA